jgi:hypothetical protein
MKVWYYSCNVVQNKATLFLDEMPWYIRFTEWLFDGILSHDSIPSIPLPNWFPKVRDKSCPDKLYTLKEWYGDLDDLYCYFVCTRILIWTQTHPKRKSYEFSLTYEELKRKLYTYDPKYFDMCEREVEEE